MEENYYPGQEPVSTDDLIFQIGELTVDLERKKKALARLTNEIQKYSQEYQALKEQASTDGGRFENLEAEVATRIANEKAALGDEISALKAAHSEELRQAQETLETARQSFSARIEEEKSNTRAEVEAETKADRAIYQKTISQLKKKLEKQRVELAKLKDTDTEDEA